MAKKMIKKRSFALTEIIIVCVIIAILGAVAIVTYQRAREKADQLLCETREKLIYTAVKVYLYDNNAVPASLIKVWPLYKDRAVAQLREENRKDSFSFIRNWALSKVAEAKDFSEYYGKDILTITCPRDKTPPRFIGDELQVSYTINPLLRGKSISFLNANKDLPLIYESDVKDGGVETIIHRHRVGQDKVANYITAEGKPGKMTAPGQISKTE